MEKLLKKYDTSCWDNKCQKSLDVIKDKMVIASILIFLDWKKEFHVHVDASCIALGALSVQPREGDIDHPIAFASHKLSKAERNYSMTEWKGLAMVYALQNFRNYLLGVHFKMFIDHSMLKYLVNKPMLVREDLQMDIVVPRI